VRCNALKDNKIQVLSAWQRRQAKTAKELNIKHLHSTTYEKLPEIPGKKQALHRDHGGGVECVAGVCDHFYLLCQTADGCM
jgi:hypothetical protein